MEVEWVRSSSWKGEGVIVQDDCDEYGTLLLGHRDIVIG